MVTSIRRREATPAAVTKPPSGELSPDAHAIVKLSDGLSGAVVRVFEAGSWGLVVLFIGALCMIVSVLVAATNIKELNGFERWTIAGAVIVASFAIGALMVFMALGYAAVRSVREKRRILDRISENAAMLNAVQEVALQATHATFNLQTLLISNVEQVRDVLLAAAPVLELFGASDFADQQNLNAKIVDFLHRAQQVVQSAKKALVEANPKPLLGYTRELEAINKAVVDVLKKPPGEVARIQANFREGAERLKGTVRDFGDSLEQVNAAILGYVTQVNELGERAPIKVVRMTVDSVDRAFKTGLELQDVLHLTSRANTALQEALRTANPSQLALAVDTIQEVKRRAAALIPPGPRPIPAS